jgi:hypothetical protein
MLIPAPLGLVLGAAPDIGAPALGPQEPVAPPSWPEPGAAVEGAAGLGVQAPDAPPAGWPRIAAMLAMMLGSMGPGGMPIGIGAPG